MVAAAAMGAIAAERAEPMVYDRRMGIPSFTRKVHQASDTAADRRSAEELVEVAVARLWERIAVAIAGATLAAGCGPTIIPDDDTGAGSAASEASSASATSSAGSTTRGTGGSQGDASVSTSATSDDPDASADDGPKLDLARPDIPPDPRPSDCFEPPIPPPGCDVRLEPGQVLGYRCMPHDETLSCDGITPAEAQLDAEECLGCGGFVDAVACGPVALGDTCCHWIVYSPGQSCPGRPFTVDGQARLPPVVARGDWATAIELDLGGLPAATRRALGHAWAQDGCFEHASIASFSRFVLELLALGAPSTLVADAQQALLEETGHARVFFGLAAAYGEQPVGPAALDIRGALGSSHDPAAIALGLVREGCIGETISALQLGVAAAGASDPQLGARLLVVAEEELRHAELAWAALAWLLGRADVHVRARVAQAFAHATTFVPRAADASDELPSAVLRAHGRLGAAERLALAERALSRVVAPAAARLLEPWTTAAPAGSARVASIML